MHRAHPAVVFVHDDGNVRVAAARWLAEAGFRCYVADDAASAGRTLRTVRPAVVIVAARLAGGAALAWQVDDRPFPTALVVIADARSRRHARNIEAEWPGNHISIDAPLLADDLLHAVRCALTWRAEVSVLAERARQALIAAVRTRHRELWQVVATSSSARTAHERLHRSFDAPPPVFDHARRVAGLAREIAQSLNLSVDVCAEIEGAALLHDIGKLALPDAVLAGEAPIGDPEMEVLLDSHARTLQLLEGAPALAAVSVLIRRSREWWDGSSSAEGLSGFDIPIGARILAVADAIQTEQDCEGGSATAVRLGAAIERRAGTRFDPDLVRIGLETVESRSGC